ncbi:MAG: FtsX-like permease family protein, partial [Acidimicrobiia bacterium]
MRAIDPRLIVKLTSVGDMYATQFGAQLLASRVIGGFGLSAFVVAVAGLYGFMSFLVACRTAEIGVRMALGADRAQILRMVMGASTRLVAYGIGLGTAGAIAVSRWIQSQLFEVSAIDPLTIAGVAT